MGWRGQDNRVRANAEAERKYLADLPGRNRVRLRVWQAFGVAILVCVTLILIAVARAEPIDRVEVIDGDTIRAHGVVFRLVGFDAPEVGGRAKCESERTLAAAATRRLRQLVVVGGLDLQRVPCSCPRGTEGTQRCNFGRLCGTLRVAERDVGDILISEGLARPFICGTTRCPPLEGWCG